MNLFSFIYNSMKKHKILRKKFSKKNAKLLHYRTLLREITRDLNKWSDIPCSWRRRQIHYLSPDGSIESMQTPKNPSRHFCGN